MGLFVVERRNCKDGTKKGRGGWPEEETKPTELNSGLVIQQQVFAIRASCSYMLVWEQKLFSLEDL